VLHICGGIIIFFSLFLDWYYFKGYDNTGVLKISWSYNLFSEWTPSVLADPILNGLEKPENLGLPFIINVIFIITLIVAIYGVMYKDVEKEEKLEKLTTIAYINVFLLILDVYYILAFPVVFLVSNQLYFPFLDIIDPASSFNFSYSIGPGYVLICISFFMIFPYIIFYYQTISNFIKKEHSIEHEINRYIEHVNIPLDIDKSIQEENLKLKLKGYNSSKESIGEMRKMIFKR
jgi:cytochrome bd-type quinol oxidase subunit 2